MLLRLRIKNLAIIDNLTLDFPDGFTVLTGETGAGKSIIIGALNLVLGERAKIEDVRSGCESAAVEALFDVTRQKRLIKLLSDSGLLDPEEKRGRDSQAGARRPVEIVIRREVGKNGRSRGTVNQKLVTISVLKKIGDLLADLHGQHRHQSLLKPELHREILDDFGGTEIASALAAYKELHTRFCGVVSRLKTEERDEREVERLKGLLEYQLNEINSAGLEPGEDAALEKERSRLTHALTLQQNTSSAINLLYEGEVEQSAAADLIAQSRKLIEEAAALDPSLEDLVQRIKAAIADLDDIASELRAYSTALEHDPARLDWVEERLHNILRITKKYGATIEDVLHERDRMGKELESLENSEEEKERLEKEKAAIARDLVNAANDLSTKRRAAGKRFSSGLVAILNELEMPHVRFDVLVKREEACSGTENDNSMDGQDEDSSSGESSLGNAAGLTVAFRDGKSYRVHSHGSDNVEFLINPNPGESLKPLRKIASGGELSRVMLALKELMRSLDQVPTLVFDEIDTGISGRTGESIGEKMAELSKQRQVICITHLPQIAARAHEQFAVKKISKDKRTLTRVDRLDDKKRIEEIARLLSGKASSTAAKQHARELLQ